MDIAAPQERKDYSTAQRVEMAKKGWAIPIRDAKGNIVDGSYPIADTGDLSNAIQAFGRAGNQAQVKAHIIKRARALGATKMLPDSWNTNTSDDDLVMAVDGWRRELGDTGLGLFSRTPPAEVRGFDGGTGDGSLTIHGVAAVFGTPTTLYENKNVRISEELSPGAFSDVLQNPQTLVHLNHGHDMRQVMASSDVAASQVGGLELRQNSTGLGYFARVNPKVSYVNDVAALIQDGVIRGASFKFLIGDEDRVEGEDDTGKRTVHYRVNQISKLSDVCVCAQGAYRQATSNVRSYATMAELLDRRSDTDSLGTARRTLSVGVIPAASSDGLSGPDLDSQVAAARARVRVANATLR